MNPSCFFQNTYESAYAHPELVRSCDKAKFCVVFIRLCLNSCKHFSLSCQDDGTGIDFGHHFSSRLK